eukprot:4317606-Alexandrium_andersonii.AAC.1
MRLVVVEALPMPRVVATGGTLAWQNLFVAFRADQAARGSRHGPKQLAGKAGPLLRNAGAAGWEVAASDKTAAEKLPRATRCELASRCELANTASKKNCCTQCATGVRLGRLQLLE